MPQAAAECWIELPEILSEVEPPTPRMAELQQAVLAEFPKHTSDFTDLAALLQEEPLSEEQIEAATGAIWERWVEEALPTLDALFVYGTYGER